LQKKEKSVILSKGMQFRKDKDMTEEKIARINELYHKSKAEGLTEEEKKEQFMLRQEYIAAIKGAISAQMENVSVEEADGTIVSAVERRRQKGKN